MADYIQSPDTSTYLAITDTSTQTALLAVGRYRWASTVDAYIAIGANPTASAADGSHIVLAGQEFMIVIRTSSAKVAAIRIGSTSGAATLSKWSA